MGGVAVVVMVVVVLTNPVRPELYPPEALCGCVLQNPWSELILQCCRGMGLWGLAVKTPRRVASVELPSLDPRKA